MDTSACCYEIRLAETIDSCWQSWFQDLKMIPVLDHSGPGTLLRGRLPDQAALFGLLSRVRNLNLTLLEVRRVTMSEAADIQSARHTFQRRKRL